MEHPFLRDNELILIDYLPGSSGQLLMRLWSELDSRLSYSNPKIISETSITKHKSTREIEYDIMIPKRLTNWFLDKCHPSAMEDYLSYFEFLGTTLLALSQKWKRGVDGVKFYDSSNYQMVGYRRLYGIHTWDKIVPFDRIRNAGYNVRCISIVPKTERGLRYQFSRCTLCYPDDLIKWKMDIDVFNAKPVSESIDFCTMLTDKDTDSILNWLRDSLGPDLREDKIPRVIEILGVYYREIVDPLEVSHV